MDFHRPAPATAASPAITSLLTRTTLLCLPLLLGACTASPESRELAGGKPACDASLADHFIGQYANGYIEREATKDAGATTARTLAPDSAATMDFNPTRLNIYTDPGAVIIKMACG